MGELLYRCLRVVVTMRKVEEKEIPTKLKRLIELSKDIFGDKEIKQWVWEHTVTEDHADTVGFNLKYMGYDMVNGFVDWENGV